MNATAERKKLLKLKKKISKKRPKFSKFESWRFVRIKDYWRRPTGIDNKMRQKRKGWPKSVKIGYRSPKIVRHLHPSSLEEIAIFNVGDLLIVDPESQAARIGGSVGNRKRKAILAEATNLGIRVLNPGEVLLNDEDEELERELVETKEVDGSGLEEEPEGEVEEDSS